MKALESTLRARKGVTVVLMYETLCFGLILTLAVTWVSLPYPLLIVSCLVALYALSVVMHFIQLRREGAATGRVLLDSQHRSSKPQVLLREYDASSSETLLLDKSCKEITLKYKLTERESEILRLVALGRSAKYVAGELFISHNTAKSHIKHVYEKLNIHSKQELIDLILYDSPQ